MKLEALISELMPALELVVDLRIKLRMDDACNGVGESKETARAVTAIRRACNALATARKEGVQS